MLVTQTLKYDFIKSYKGMVNNTKKLKAQKSFFQEAYLRSYPYNLIKSGNLDKFYVILTNFKFIETKIQHSKFGIQALIEDYDLIDDTELLTHLEYNTETVKALKLIQGALRLSAHILNQDAKQLTGQLTGRLLCFDVPEIQALLEQIAQTKTTCLRPLTASLTPPGGALVRTLNGHSGSVNAVTITADGRRLISGSSDNSLKVWNLETGEELFSLIGHTASVTAVAATSDSKLVISGSQDNTLRVWNLETRKELLAFKGHRNCINAISISRNSKQVVSASSDSIINIWNLETGEKQFNLNSHRSPVHTLTITSNDKLVISGSLDGIIKVWNLETGREILTFKNHNSAIRTVFVNPDGNEVVSASSNNNVRCWSLDTGKQLLNSPNKNDWVSTVTVTSDMSTVISGLSDNTLKVWNIKTGKTNFTTPNHNGSINAVAVTPNGRQFISASSDHTIKIWNLEIVDESVITYAHSASINAVAIIPNSKQVISASSDSTLKIWNMETGEKNFTLFGHTDSVNGVAVTPDGKQVVSASSDNTLQVWNLGARKIFFDFIRNSKTPKKILTLTGHNNKVNAVAISSDGKILISASSDNTIKLWKLATGKELITRPITKEKSSNYNNTFKVWYLETGEKYVCKNSDYLAFTSDRKWKISVSNNRIKVNIASTGKEACSLPVDNSIKTYFLSTNGILYVEAGKYSLINKYYYDLDNFFPSSTRYKDKLICDIYYLRKDDKFSLKLTLKGWNSFLITSNYKWAIIASNNKLIVIEMATGNEKCIIDFDSNMNTLYLNDSGNLYLSKPEKNHDNINGNDDIMKTLLFNDSGNLYLSQPEKNHDNNDDTTESLNTVAFSYSGLQVVSGSSHCALRISDLLSKENVLTIRGHKKSINAVAFSKDGLQVISASSDHTIKAWDVENQILKFSLTGHKDSVNAFVISSCGKYLISASSDTTLKVWNFQSQKEIAGFTGESSINCCAIAPDGTTIVAGEASGRLHFLRLEGTEVEQ
ncbi:WD repeat-containing protein [Calothrix sp. NIES-4071]|nr:WD repeat-containing protein [Calothrix sp. NIES-4071]BAZ59255.1 WD repeat-containing protein [Calothrix sp. NIES-4105]